MTDYPRDLLYRLTVAVISVSNNLAIIANEVKRIADHFQGPAPKPPEGMVLMKQSDLTKLYAELAGLEAREGVDDRP